MNRPESRIVINYTPLSNKTQKTLDIQFIALYSDKIDELKENFKKETNCSKRTELRFLIQKAMQLGAN